MKTRWKPGAGLRDPGPVLLVGNRAVWSEATIPLECRSEHVPDCTCGCRRPLGAATSRRGSILALEADPDSRVTIDRERCPNGCGHRDLVRERRLGLNRICLRCYCWTYDPPDWRQLASSRRVLPSYHIQTEPVRRLTRKQLRARWFGPTLPPRRVVYRPS